MYNNRGSIYLNRWKQNDKQPTHTGTCQIDGKKYKIAGWREEDASGQKKLSLTFTEIRNDDGTEHS